VVGGRNVKILLAGVVVAALIGGVWRLTSESPSEGAPEEGTPKHLVLVAVDSSGHEHDGVIQGGPAIGLRGHQGSAYSFDRPGSWVQVPPDPGLNPGRRDFVFSAWVNLKHAPRPAQTYDIIRKGLGGTPGGEFKLEILSGERVKCSTKDSRGRDRAINSPFRHIADGRWHHVGCARTGSGWSTILDGLVTTKQVDLGTISNTMAVSIGSKYGLEDVPDGRVDEVALFIDAGPRGKPSSTSAKARVRIDQLRQTEPEGLWHLDEQPIGSPSE
jgi:hypothetical protein